MKVILIFLSVILISQNGQADSSFEMFLDNVLKAMLKEKESVIDPLIIKSRIYEKVVGGPLRFLLNMDDIVVRGLKTLHRNGSAEQAPTQAGKRTILNLTLNNLTAATEVYIERSGIMFDTNIERKINVSTDFMDFVLAIEGDKTTKMINVTKMKVFDLGNIIVSVDGVNGVRGIMENLILRQVAKVMKGAIIDKLGSVLKEQIQERLNSLNDPIFRNILCEN